MSQGYVPLWARRFPLPETLPVPFNIFQLAPHRIAEHIDTPIAWVAPQMAADNGRQPIQPYMLVVPHTRRTRFPRMLLLLAPAAICTICPNSSDAWPAAPPAGSLDMRPVHCRQVTEPAAILPPRDIVRRFKWLPAVQTLQRLPFLLMGMSGG